MNSSTLNALEHMHIILMRMETIWVLKLRYFSFGVLTVYIFWGNIWDRRRGCMAWIGDWTMVLKSF
jgi:hypothetical protein